MPLTRRELLEMAALLSIAPTLDDLEARAADTGRWRTMPSRGSISARTSVPPPATPP